MNPSSASSGMTHVARVPKPMVWAPLRSPCMHQRRTVRSVRWKRRATSSVLRYPSIVSSSACGNHVCASQPNHCGHHGTSWPVCASTLRQCGNRSLGAGVGLPASKAMDYGLRSVVAWGKCRYPLGGDSACCRIAPVRYVQSRYLVSDSSPPSRLGILCMVASLWPFSAAAQCWRGVRVCSHGLGQAPRENQQGERRMWHAGEGRLPPAVASALSRR